MRVLCDIDKTLPTLVRPVAEQKTASKLDRFAESVEEVHVMVKDLNGPKGGIDTECQIRVRLRNMPPVIVQQRSESIGKALYNALERASRNVARSIEKQTQRLHGANRRLPRTA
ncbi:MAG: HPF/RaiA family ribosome-associated protein [Rubinisphaera brasiliensis]|uniref:Ribosomal subunit interface protein n=1 Tax=Rubinisphaera brasiliensis (strain ATCC 49424 / DSM 5305 / JCM 21570 / IAM 15109 / NBRC 103401 / IFAM 1448) TaxID=756272 RepID=F0SFQ0_RUBBR|nr:MULTISPECIES: HPF/RaiA family ribosome-associated protein [Rubinisphaera]ADY60510.1 hypothetical protein Plabr_2911 [Rubinisphaera brasiliensis DSM 5305]MBB03356.1 hypothetical protein [Planctomyces sp.]MBR9803189.1 HPF/RaiA family ribosome-associated protein [bacterium]